MLSLRFFMAAMLRSSGNIRILKHKLWPWLNFEKLWASEQYKSLNGCRISLYLSTYANHVESIANIYPTYPWILTEAGSWDLGWIVPPISAQPKQKVKTTFNGVLEVVHKSQRWSKSSSVSMPLVPVLEDFKRVTSCWSIAYAAKVLCLYWQLEIFHIVATYWSNGNIINSILFNNVQVGWRRSGMGVWSPSGCRLICTLRQSSGNQQDFRRQRSNSSPRVSWPEPQVDILFLVFLFCLHPSPYSHMYVFVHSYRYMFMRGRYELCYCLLNEWSGHLGTTSDVLELTMPVCLGNQCQKFIVIMICYKFEMPGWYPSMTPFHHCPQLAYCLWHFALMLMQPKV